MVLLQLHSPTIMQASNSEPMLHSLLDILDKFNKLAPGCNRDDLEDLSWPGVWGKNQQNALEQVKDTKTDKL